MSATPYKAISFKQHDVVTRDKLNYMQYNMQWLLDNTPRSRHFTETAAYDSGLVSVAGRTYVPRNKYSHSGVTSVYFGDVFKPGTSPDITTGICADQRKSVWVQTNGLGSLDVPDHRGFNILIYVETIASRPAKVRGKKQKDKPDRPMYVFWHATGIRSDA